MGQLLVKPTVSNPVFVVVLFMAVSRNLKLEVISLKDYRVELRHFCSDLKSLCSSGAERYLSQSAI